MFIMLLLFSSIAFAEDLSSEKYCFPGTNGMLVAEKKFAGIQVPSDEVTRDENCLMIKMRPHRRELIQRFFLSTVPGTQVTFSSEDSSQDPCLLKVEKKKKAKNENTSAEINQAVQIGQTVSSLDATETMQIQTLKDFELSVDQDQIKGRCRYITANRYEISIEVRKNPKPIVPVPLPPGTIVVINEPPKDQETMSLQTQLILNRGEKIELGNIVKNLKDKDRNLDIKPEFTINAGQQNASEQVFLSLQ